MITTITLNPCVDRTIEIEKFLYGGTNKVVGTRNDISGKGINVNIVLQHLGVENEAIGFDYREDSEKFLGFLKELGCGFSFIKVKGDLRTNVKIFDQTTAVMSEFNDRGGAVKQEDVDKFMELLISQLDKTSLLVVSGSVPPGVPCNIYEQIIDKANEKSVKTILDVSGELLLNGIKATPYLIKPNEEELSITYNREIKTIEDIIEVSQLAISQGVKYVCVSRGSRGAVFITSDRVYAAEPLRVDIRGVQGAGDSMVAGFCYAIENGMDDEAIFRHGVACATGSLTHPGTQLCMYEDMKKMLPLIRITEL